MKGGTKFKQIESSRSVRALAAVSELRAKIDASAAKTLGRFKSLRWTLDLRAAPGQSGKGLDHESRWFQGRDFEVFFQRDGSRSQNAGLTAQGPKKDAHVPRRVSQGLPFHDLGHLVEQSLSCKFKALIENQNRRIEEIHQVGQAQTKVIRCLLHDSGASL